MNARVVGMIREWEWDCIIIMNMRNAELMNSSVDFRRIFILHFHLIIPLDVVMCKDISYDERAVLRLCLSFKKREAH